MHETFGHGFLGGFDYRSWSFDSGCSWRVNGIPARRALL
jgi:hypothetical protein